MAAATAPTAPTVAAPTAPAAAPAAPTPQLTAYHEFFGNTTLDPHQQDYQALMRAYRVYDTPTPAQSLYNSAGLSTSAYPMAYLSLINDNGNLFYLLVHAPAFYKSLPGVPSRCDGKTYAFTGDVVANTITTVEFPQDAFMSPGTGTEENVPKDLERALDILQLNPDDTSIGPFQDTDANIKQAKTQQERALHQLLPQHCLIDLLMMQRRELLEQHLPGLKEASLPSMLGIQQSLAQSVNELVRTQTDAQTEATARDAKAKAPKSVDEFFGPMLHKLLSVLHVQDTSQCPPVWSEWASQPKKADLDVLETALRSQASSEATGGFGIVPIVTPDLVKKVKAVKLGGNDTDDLEEGIHPFSIVLPSYGGSDVGVTKAARERAAAYAEVHGGSGASLQDAIALRKPTVHIPDTFSKARSHLMGLLTLWQVLLPFSHPFLRAYGMFLQQYVRDEANFTALLDKLPRPEPKPALFLRAVQVRMVNYWQSVESSMSYQPDPPNFVDILVQIRQRSDSWIAALPANYWSEPVAQLPTAPWNGGYLPYMMPPGMVPMSSDSSGASSLTPHSVGYPPFFNGFFPPQGAGIKPGEDDQKSKGKNSLQVKNSTHVPELVQFRKLALATAVPKAEQKAGSPPPEITHSGTKVQMCVGYHVKGKCWEKCPRAADHVAHSAQDTAKLVAWCKEAYAEE
ncbi:unnamed protein product [Cylindrotheca closterium]|uniref:Uncharacterized protein n=1 Tax=Cylindrotheca closterium TaxID=2856 RepID=A0AAD2FWX7_9STRA|nr:unnamed protein product [Cylindrotheca closterium]